MIPIRTRYLASLDSVRFNPAQKFTASVSHSEVDIALALLSGQRVTVSESMACDSAGFLKTVSVLLGEEVQAHKKIWMHEAVSAPIHLAVYQAPDAASRSFREALAEKFGNTHQPNKTGFKLSAWSVIDSDNGLRQKVSNFIRTSNWKEGSEELTRVMRDKDAALLETYLCQFDALRILCEYADNNPSIQGSASPTEMKLADYLAILDELIVEDVFKSDSEIVAMMQRLHSTSKSIVEASEAKSLTDRSCLRRYKEALVKPDSVGDAAVAEALAKKGVTSDHLDLLIAFIDIAYNQVIGTSVRADVPVLVGQPVIRPNREIEICQLLVELLRYFYYQRKNLGGGDFAEVDIGFYIEREKPTGSDLNVLELQAFRHLFPLATVVEHLRENDRWSFLINESSIPGLSDKRLAELRKERMDELGGSLKTIALKAHDHRGAIRFSLFGAGVAGSLIFSPITSVLTPLAGAVAGKALNQLLGKFVAAGLQKPYEIAADGFARRLAPLVC